MYVLNAQNRRDIAKCYDKPGQRYYVRGKLAIDPVYGAATDAFAQQPLPLLDIGCGIGLLAHYLHAFHLLKHDYVGLDHDPRKITIGKAAAARAGLTSRTHLSSAEAKDLQPIQGHVALLDILHYVPREQQPQLLRQAVRHLAPNGQLILRNVLRAPTWRFHATRLEEYFLRVSGWIPGGVQHYPSAEEIRAPLEMEGLHVTFAPLYGRTPYNSYLVTAHF